jgi:hypothetical protein
MTSGAQVYQRASLGDFTDVPRAIDELARSSAPIEREWSTALDALHRMTTGQPPIEPEQLALADSTPLALAARQSVLGAALAFDRARLRRWIAALARAGGPNAAVRSLAHGWDAVLGGASLPAATRDDPSVDPGLAIEAMVQRALVELECGDRMRVIALGRQASRMAASEGLLQLEYLANLALARIRRRTSSSHLAVRILSSLREVVPPIWRGWIAWELALAGHVEGGPLEAATHAATAGDADRFRGAIDQRLRSIGFDPLAREVRVFGEMVDPDASSSEAAPWLEGTEHELPLGIADPLRDPLSVAYVAARPRARSRRMLRVGLPLLGPRAFVIASSLRGRRAHEALAISALGGPDGVEIDRLFRALYGSSLEDITHEEVFRGLVHRMRAEVGDAAEVARTTDRIMLVPHVPLALPDPRSERSLADRILAFVASRNGRATAKEVATALGVPLRTVQRTLGTLVDEGACAAEPDGRRTEYVVEDTTFHEPTLHRLRGRSAK